MRRVKAKRLTVPKKPAMRVAFAEGGGDMSNRLRRELKILKQNIAMNTRTVEQRLAKTGTTAPSGALVASAAKYYPALKKLAEK